MNKILLIILVIPILLFSNEYVNIQSDYYIEDNYQYSRITYYPTKNNFNLYKDINIILCGKLSDISLLDKTKYFLINIINEIIQVEEEINLTLYYPKNNEIIYFRVQKSNHTDFRNLIRTINLLVSEQNYLDKEQVENYIKKDAYNVILSLENNFNIGNDKNILQLIFRESKEAKLLFNHVEYSNNTGYIYDTNNIDYEKFILNFYDNNLNDIKIDFSENYGIKFASTNTIYGINNYFFTKLKNLTLQPKKQDFKFIINGNNYTISIHPSKENNKIKNDLVKLFDYNLYIYTILNDDFQLFNNILSKDIDKIKISSSFLELFLSNIKEMLLNENFLSNQEMNIYTSRVNPDNIPDGIMINFKKIDELLSVKKYLKTINIIKPEKSEELLDNILKYLSIENSILYISDINNEYNDYYLFLKIKNNYLNRIGKYLIKNYIHNNDKLFLYKNYIVISSFESEIKNNISSLLKYIEEEISTTEINQINIPLNYFKKIYDLKYQEYKKSLIQNSINYKLKGYRNKYYDFLKTDDEIYYEYKKIEPPGEYRGEERYIKLNFEIDEDNKLVLNNKREKGLNINLILPLWFYKNIFDIPEFNKINDVNGYLVIFEDNSKIIIRDDYKYTPAILHKDYELSTDKIYVKRYNGLYYLSSTKKGLKNLTEEVLNEIEETIEYEGLFFINNINDIYIKDRYFHYLKRIQQKCFRNIYFKSYYDNIETESYICPALGDYILDISLGYICSKHNNYFHPTDIYYNYSKSEYELYKEIFNNISIFLGFNENESIINFSLNLNETLYISSPPYETRKYIYIIIIIIIIILILIIYIVLRKCKKK